ncbi:Golgi reassembly-stacking protein 2 [Dirofilaria immitis]|nr:Golgi reassembly-stacking protein 2 [Dirofilaria immitis]
MGNSGSTNIPGGGTEGYHVLRVQDNSPGQAAGLEPFFDFIVCIETHGWTVHKSEKKGESHFYYSHLISWFRFLDFHTITDTDNDTLKDILKQHVERSLELTVYNSKTQTVRQTQITPSQMWGGQGLLGISIRFCSLKEHVKMFGMLYKFSSNSPAEIAGLQSNLDYILGAESVLNQADDLIAHLQANEGKPIKLYVYNTESDSVREFPKIFNNYTYTDFFWSRLRRTQLGVVKDAWDVILGDRRGPLKGEEIAAMLKQQLNGTDSSNTTQFTNNDNSCHPGPAAVSSNIINIPQPGSTGIPQIDSIQPITKFPDPNSFIAPILRQPMVFAHAAVANAAQINAPYPTEVSSGFPAPIPSVTPFPTQNNGANYTNTNQEVQLQQQNFVADLTSTEQCGGTPEVMSQQSYYSSQQQQYMNNPQYPPQPPVYNSSSSFPQPPVASIVPPMFSSLPHQQQKQEPYGIPPLPPQISTSSASSFTNSSQFSGLNFPMPPLSTMGITELAHPPNTIPFGLSTSSFGQQKQSDISTYSAEDPTFKSSFQMTRNNQFSLPPQGIV